jgi:phage gp46-like protein
MDFYGDLLLSPTEDGGAITFEGGQPLMDKGLATACYLSLFTNSGWWASPALGSSLSTLERSTLTNTTRLNVAESARKALAWLTEGGIASSVVVECEILTVSTLSLVVTITEPDSSETTLRYRINWAAMQETA